MRRALQKPLPGRLVLALTWNSEIADEQMFDVVQRLWGQIGLRSPVFDFSHTPYYESEMGNGLRKCFVEICGNMPREQLVDEKLKAWRLEEDYMNAHGQRNLNIDPMIVTLENVVISTSKNFSHRLYLGREVFGDLAFLFRAGHFEAMPWTYPDYKEQVSYFEQVRSGLPKR